MTSRHSETTANKTWNTDRHDHDSMMSSKAQEPNSRQPEGARTHKSTPLTHKHTKLLRRGAEEGNSSLRSATSPARATDPGMTTPGSKMGSRQPHPHELPLWNLRALLLRLSFSWVTPYISNARDGDSLELQSLPEIPLFDSAGLLSQRLEESWNAQHRTAHKNPSRMFWSAIRATCARLTLLSTICLAVEVAMQLLQVYCMGKIVLHLQQDNDSVTSSDTRDAYLWAFGFALTVLIPAFMHHHVFFHQARIGFIARTSTIGTVYRKLLRLSKQKMAAANSGKIITLISADAERFVVASQLLGYVFITPFTIIAATYLLWEIIGAFSLLAIAITLVAIPWSIVASRLAGKFRFKVAEQTDQRVKLTSELLGAMRVVKMYAWEQAFASVIAKVRAVEVKYLRKSTLVLGTSLAYYFASASLAAVLTFIAYQLTGHTVTAYAVFTCLGYFYLVRVQVTYLLPMALKGLAESVVASSRIQQFLDLPEGTTSATVKPNTNDKDDVSLPNVSIQANNMTCEWIPGKVILKSVSLELRNPSLICIAGPVGSGKSTLLLSIMGEIAPASGTLHVRGSLAYSSQEAWILPTTLKENILFGLDMDAVWYNKVIDACALRDDLADMPFGDDTEVCLIRVYIYIYICACVYVISVYIYIYECIANVHLPLNLYLVVFARPYGSTP
jgi:ATP-binding cassette, subfamily C (CFTR/MRP), member 4